MGVGMNELHEELHGDFYSEFLPLTVAQLRAEEERLYQEEETIVVAEFNDDGLLEAVETEEVQAAPQPGSRGMGEKWFRLQKYKADLEECVSEFMDTAETRFSFNPATEAHFSIAFKSACAYYFCVRSSSATGAFKIRETRGAKRNFLPSRSDFAIDVELAAKRALKNNPELMKLWQAFFVDGLGFHVDHIPTKFWNRLVKQVGEEFLRSRMYPLGNYFCLSVVHPPKEKTSLVEALLSRKQKSGPHAMSI